MGIRGGEGFFAKKSLAERKGVEKIRGGWGVFGNQPIGAPNVNTFWGGARESKGTFRGNGAPKSPSKKSLRAWIDPKGKKKKGYTGEFINDGGR